MKQILTTMHVSDVIQEAMRPYRQITGRFSDGKNGRCVMGGVMSFLGWDGDVSFDVYTSNPKCEEYLKKAVDLVGGDNMWDTLALKNNQGETVEEIVGWLRSQGL